MFVCTFKLPNFLVCVFVVCVVCVCVCVCVCVGNYIPIDNLIMRRPKTLSQIVYFELYITRNETICHKSYVKFYINFTFLQVRDLMKIGNQPQMNKDNVL